MNSPREIPDIVLDVLTLVCICGIAFITIGLSILLS